MDSSVAFYHMQTKQYMAVAVDGAILMTTNTNAVTFFRPQSLNVVGPDAGFKAYCSSGKCMRHSNYRMFMAALNTNGPAYDFAYLPLKPSRASKGFKLLNPMPGSFFLSVGGIQAVISQEMSESDWIIVPESKFVDGSLASFVAA